MAGNPHSNLPLDYVRQELRLYHDAHTCTWVFLDDLGNVLWDGSLPVPPSLRPRPSDALPSHPLPAILPWTQHAPTQVTEAHFPAPHPSGQAIAVSGPASAFRVEVLGQRIYERGLSSDIHIPDITFDDFRLRDALNNQFSFLEDPEGAAWPHSIQTPQKLAVVVCFEGYDKPFSRQFNVLRHIRGRTFPPTRAKIAHIVACTIDDILQSGNTTCPGGLLTHGARRLTLDDLVLMNVQHASRGSLQPTIGVIVRF